MRGLCIGVWSEAGSSMGSCAVVLGGGVTPRVTPVHAAWGWTYGLEVIREWGKQNHWDLGLLFTAIDACEAHR